MTTYMECNTAEVDVSADTDTQILNTTIPSGKGGRIKQIKIGGGNVVNAETVSGYLELRLGSHSGPWRFPIMAGAGAATIGKSQPAETIDVDIEVFANETVEIRVTMTGTFTGCHAGIVWVA